MALRVCRIRMAAIALPNTKAGMMEVASDCRQSTDSGTYPDGGSQPNCTDTSNISMIPSQKFGVDSPASPTKFAT